MKKMSSLAIASVAAVCLSTASARAGSPYVSPRAPAHPKTLQAQAQALEMPGVSSAQTWTVTSPWDGGPGSLRQVIANAAPGDSIRFALGFRGNTIVLTNTLVISQNLTLAGPGPDRLTIMRGNATNTPDFRCSEVAGGVVTLSGMTISNWRRMTWRARMTTSEVASSTRGC